MQRRFGCGREGDDDSGNDAISFNIDFWISSKKRFKRQKLEALEKRKITKQKKKAKSCDKELVSQSVRE